MEDCRNPRTSTNCDPLDGGAKIGRILKQTRRKRGLSLDEVEQATKIRARYLSGLEREDYAMLPAAVYTQGFLKTYANYLGLDGEALGEALSWQLRSRRRPRREGGINYKPPSSDLEQPLISSSGVTGTEKRMVSTSAVVTLLAALLALAALTGPLYLVGRGVHLSNAEENAPPAPTAEKAPGGFRQEPQSTADDARAPAEPGEELVSRTEDVTGEGTDGAPQAEEPTAAEQSAPADTLLVSVTVQERPAWILVRSDGVLAYEETVPPGFTQTFEADSQLSITSGDAGAVTVEVNGQDAGALGSVGEVVTKSFNLKSPS